MKAFEIPGAGFGGLGQFWGVEVVQRPGASILRAFLGGSRET